MIEPFEQLTIIRYIQNILARDLSSQAFKEICDFLETGMPFLGIEGNLDDILDTIDEYQNAVRKNTGSRSLFRALHLEINALLQQRINIIKDARSGAIEKNIRTISDELELDPIEADFFALLVRYRTHDQLYSLLNDLTREHIGILDLCSTCIGKNRTPLAERLGQGSRLITTGVIIQKSRSGKDLDDHFDVTDIISSAMQKTLNNLEDVRTYILGTPQPHTLEWTDFDHLGPTRDKLAAFLTEATRKKIPGVNILLWGPPGTGKTEFCKTLAAQLNLNLYSLGEVDDEGDEPNRKERTSALQIAQNLLRHQSNNLLLFDEMDDLFENKGIAMLFGAKFSSGSKVFTNRLFENNPVPTIWTINQPSHLDESVIRRMALAIEIKVPTATSRKTVWKRLLDKNNLSVPDDALTKLAEIEVSPAVASNAVKFAGIVGSSYDDFHFATEGIIKATKGRAPKPTLKNDGPYLPALIHTDTDVGTLADRLATTRARDFSLCLYGPPGTGKSAYVRYLAERTQMPVLFKRASDLLSTWVGGSEKNIATAFEEAQDKEAFLVFDEADSLLSDRRYARQSWEVSQVNEMLTWMESHPLPFACTTNLKERLDQAAMRRFTFKCHFGYLTSDQVPIAFRHFFGQNLGPNDARRLSTLTPGDFAVVRKKIRFFEKEQSSAQLIDLLQQEVEAKNEIHQRTIGFSL
ncbi:MAG: AAA family ATPase [Desulfuromonas sp.]|nr:MAG: AAA family ATPase [Desulfuromonas sp.]